MCTAVFTQSNGRTVKTGMAYILSLPYVFPDPLSNLDQVRVQSVPAVVQATFIILPFLPLLLFAGLVVLEQVLGRRGLVSATENQQISKSANQQHTNILCFYPH